MNIWELGFWSTDIEEDNDTSAEEENDDDYYDEEDEECDPSKIIEKEK